MVPIEKYCHHDVIQVSESGIRAVQGKPAGKRDIVVTLKGLHPNTRDDGVMDYLAKFGTITSRKVVRPVFGDGPLKGIGHGDRMFKLELKAGYYLGTYHVIDGQRVTAKYRGQQPTCARCFSLPQSCPGNGIARRCEQEGGVKKNFADYIYQLWDKIGYVPSEVELDAEIDSELVDSESTQFTPIRSTPLDSSSYKGVRISSFPKDIDHGWIMEFLLMSGLPDSCKDNVSIKDNGTVIIEFLENETCCALISAIHNKPGLDNRRMFCNGIVPRTPDKNVNQEVLSNDQDQQVDDINPESTAIISASNPEIITTSNTVPVPVSPMSPNTFIQQYSETPDLNFLQLTGNDLARRNSLSLRSPPHGSLAEDLIMSDNSNKHYNMAKSKLRAWLINSQILPLVNPFQKMKQKNHVIFMKMQAFRFREREGRVKNINLAQVLQKSIF